MPRLDRRGITLLEALFALVILSATAISALAAARAQLQASSRAREALMAVALAEDRLARVRMLESAALSSIPDSLVLGRFPPPLEAYRWRLVSRPVLGEAYLFQVVVHVEWDDGSFELSTRLYRPPGWTP